LIVLSLACWFRRFNPLVVQIVDLIVGLNPSRLLERNLSTFV
jgi:hypothetical protein